MSLTRDTDDWISHSHAACKNSIHSDSGLLNQRDDARGVADEWADGWADEWPDGWLDGEVSS